MNPVQLEMFQNLFERDGKMEGYGKAGLEREKINARCLLSRS